jgi:lysylphosphatidylglycerol synthetase-like protein (DUF2156 family)
VLRRHAQNPVAFLAVNQQTRHFRCPGIDGLIAYRCAGRRHLVQLGGVFARQKEQATLLGAFLTAARHDRRRVLAVQLQRSDAELYAAHGFTINQLGASYARSLKGFQLSGGPFIKLRNKISRARRAGVQVFEIGVDAPADFKLWPQLRKIDTAWLHAKGRHTKELAFLIGERGGPADSERRLFVAKKDDYPIAYISFSPVFGRHGGWLHDLTRRAPDAPPGVMELIVLTAMNRFRDEGVGYFHFGFTPFTSLDADYDLPYARSRAAASAVSLLARHGAAIYPAKDQVAYKLKWAPDLVQPDYIGFQGRANLSAIWQLLRLTGAI